MRRLSLIHYFLLFLLVFSTASSQEGDKSRLSEKEIKASKKIRFQNRPSIRAAEETIQANLDLGKHLSNLADKKTDEDISHNDIIIKRIPVSEENKYGADIIILGKKTNFGHVNSIQRILTGYVSASYGYSEKDSEVLATYLLYYNAMHRKDKKYVQKKFTKDVLPEISESKIGIAIKYSDWPGKTEIIIPVEKNILKDKKKDIQVDELDKEVKKVIDTKKDGQDEKKKFDDLVNRKTETEKKDIEKKKDEIAKKEEKIKDQEKKRQERISELKKDPEKNKEEIKKEDEKQKEAEKDKRNLDEEKKEVAKKEKEIAKKEEDKKSDTGKTSDTTSKSDDKKPETKAELKKELETVKKELEKKKEDEKKKEQFDKNVVGGKILFLKTLKYLDQGHYNNEMLMIDPEKDDTLFRGDFNNICGRTFDIFADRVLIIGFKDSHSKEHKLALLDKDSLKLVGMSEVNVFWRTPMVVKGEEVYAYEEDNGKVYFSKFDKNLKRIMKSDQEVSPNSNITFYGNKIYITGKEESGQNMDIRVFNKDDLKFLKRIQP